jgi:hypothetical protein
MKMSNLDKLAQAKLIDPTQVSAEEKDVIESLTPEEVDTVIKVKSRLKAASAGKESSLMDSASEFLF